MVVFKKAGLSRTRKAAIYCRVSSEEQAKFGFSIQNQIERLKAYCEEENITVVDTYVDEGYSAGTRKRPALKKMLEEKHKFDLILFTKLDRFTRNVLDANEMVKELQAFDVNIKAIDEDDIDTSTADGMFMFNLKVSLAQRELAKGSERIKTVFDYKVKQGQPITGTSIFGYKIHTAEDGIKSYVIDEEAAPIVNEVFNHFIMYQSMRGTANHCNEKFGINRSINFYRNMINREYYTGMFHGNANYFPPYITMEKFERIQDIIKNNIKVKKLTNDPIFIGLLRCHKCGRKLTSNVFRKKRKKTGVASIYKYYRCNTISMVHYDNCGVNYNETYIEKEFLRQIKPLAEKYIYEAKLKPAETPKKQNDLAELLEELDRLNYSFRKKRITVDDYDKEYDILERRIAAAKMETPKERDISGIEAFLNSGWEEVYHNLTWENKRALVRSVVKEIVIEENGDMQIEFI